MAIDTSTPYSPTTVLLGHSEMQIARRALTENGSLDDVYQTLGAKSPDGALETVASTLGIPLVDLSKAKLNPDAMEGFPVRFIHRYNVFPIDQNEDGLLVATNNPFDLNAFDDVANTLGVRVTPALVAADELSKLVKQHLGVGAETIDGLLSQVAEDRVEMLDQVDFDSSEDAAMAQEASVVRLVNEILGEAVHSRASDIHVEAQENGIKIRYRIDGVLQKQPTPPEINRFQAAIISRLKIMAQMNIAEKRVPQDGRIKLRVSGRAVDIRVSVIPMLHGEGIVMRVLDKDNLNFSLRGIGMPQATYDSFQKLIRLPHGIILVTGPTGSGKTTTLYSALSEIKSEDTKIITTEDPIEYQLQGINQIQVNPKVGLTFAASLRSILRHDPDVVLVGEIRDLETAENATQASLTGHLVFSTLHTNDSSGAFMRLCDMGVEPFLVSSTVEGVMAQRLVRKLCTECREPVAPETMDLPSDFPVDHVNGGRDIFVSKGCRHCRGVGYSGRMGIYELLFANDEIRHLANERQSSTMIKRAAQDAGMKTLREDGWQKVIQGITTVDEVLRVTKAD